MTWLNAAILCFCLSRLRRDGHLSIPPYNPSNERFGLQTPGSLPIKNPQEIPTTTHTGGINKRVMEKKRGNPAPRKPSSKLTSMSRMERGRERSKLPAVYPQAFPKELPTTAHAGGKNKRVTEKKRGNAKPKNLSTKVTSMSGMERGRERSVGKLPADYPQTIPMEIPITTHTGGKNKLEKNRGNARSRKLSMKMTSMSKMERGRETSVIEKGVNLGEDETSLGFAPFW